MQAFRLKTTPATFNSTYYAWTLKKILRPFKIFLQSCGMMIKTQLTDCIYLVVDLTTKNKVAKLSALCIRNLDEFI